MAPKLDSRFNVFVGFLVLSIFSPITFAEKAELRANESFPKGLQGNVTHGQAIFEGHCVRCHGSSGDGKGPESGNLELKPISFQTDSFRAEFSRRDIFTSTALGKLGTHMPTWLKKMDDQNVADVSEYVYQRFVLRQVVPTR